MSQKTDPQYTPMQTYQQAQFSLMQQEQQTTDIYSSRALKVATFGAESSQQSNSEQGINAPQERIFTGIVTTVYNSFGFVDEDVFFLTSSCVKGCNPIVGERVLVKAVYNPNMPYKWNATQVLPVGRNESTVSLDGRFGSSYSSRHPPSEQTDRESNYSRRDRSPPRKNRWDDREIRHNNRGDVGRRSDKTRGREDINKEPFKEKNWARSSHTHRRSESPRQSIENSRYLDRKKRNDEFEEHIHQNKEREHMQSSSTSDSIKHFDISQSKGTSLLQPPAYQQINSVMRERDKLNLRDVACSRSGSESYLSSNKCRGVDMEVTSPILDEIGENTYPKPSVRRRYESPVRVVVVPRDYPFIPITVPQEDILLPSLSDALKRLQGDYGDFPRFHKCYFEKGALNCLCADQVTVHWLTSTIPTLNLWEGADLVVCAEHLTKVSFKTPKLLVERKPHELLFLLQKQNPQLNTSNWKLMRIKKEAESRSFVVLVDNTSLKAIRSMKYRAFLALGQVFFEMVEQEQNT